MHKLEPILNRLKEEMISLDCWQDYPVNPEALMSTEPFCIDTLSFPQWLQFILIPRLRALIEGGFPLPSGSGVLPLGQEYFKNHNNSHQLFIILNDIDEVLGKAQR